MFPSERKTLYDFLQALTYPAAKVDIIRQAQQKGLPGQLVQLLQRLDEQTYQNAAAVEQDLAVHKA
jgi:hypothetical protein